MTCHDPKAVEIALINRLSAVNVGPYRVEYINDTSPYNSRPSQHLCIVERGGGVVDVIETSSNFFNSIIEYYGAEGVSEKY
jgi:hypothetical protein